MDAIIASNNLPLLEAESDVESGILVVKALQWNAANGKLVQVVANANTGLIVRTLTWTPTAAQNEKYADSISVIGSISIQWTAPMAVSEALVTYPAGTTVHAIELEEEDERPQWKVELVTASGVEIEVRIWAD